MHSSKCYAQIKGKREELNMSSKGREQEIKRLLEKDSKFEGRDKYFMDVDRMINGGLANGLMVNREDYQQIDQARSLEKEEPPLKIE